MNLADPNFKIHGSAPIRLVLVHGGPGAIGSLAPLAKELSGEHGVIEAYQTRDSIDELLTELQNIISQQAGEKVILVGHSWGAWLSLLYAYRNQADISKIIMIASPPILDEFASRILQTRLDRLEQDESNHLLALMQQIEAVTPENTNDVFIKIATILRKADAYSLYEQIPQGTKLSYFHYNSIWNEAAQLRSSGELLRIASGINCPVLALHGDHDPHPAKGVDAPLGKMIRDFRFILLEKCGHEPWSEKFARDEFFQILRNEIN